MMKKLEDNRIHSKKNLKEGYVAKALKKSLDTLEVDQCKLGSLQTACSLFSKFQANYVSF